MGGDTGRAINRCFKHSTLEKITEALVKEVFLIALNHLKDTKWATSTLDMMNKASPTSLRLTLLALQKGVSKSFTECLRMEHRMVQAALLAPDFSEGVTALLVEKRAPVWATAPSVEELQKEYFNIHGQHELEFVDAKPSTYWTYPHHTMSGLPTSQDIKDVVEGNANRGDSYRMGSREDILEFVMANWGAFDRGAIGIENGEVRRFAIKGGNGAGKGGW